MDTLPMNNPKTHPAPTPAPEPEGMDTYRQAHQQAASALATAQERLQALQARVREAQQEEYERVLSRHPQVKFTSVYGRDEDDDPEMADVLLRIEVEVSAWDHRKGAPRTILGRIAQGGTTRAHGDYPKQAAWCIDVGRLRIPDAPSALRAQANLVRELQARKLISV